MFWLDFSYGTGILQDEGRDKKRLQSTGSQIADHVQIRESTSDIMYKLSQMKFESPNTQSEEDIAGKFDQLHNEIQEAFRRLQE